MPSKKYFTKEERQIAKRLDQKRYREKYPEKVKNQYENPYPSYHSNPWAPSVDRINSKEGYYMNNIQLILNWLNRAKKEYSQELFLSLLQELPKALTTKE